MLTRQVNIPIKMFFFRTLRIKAVCEFSEKSPGRGVIFRDRCVNLPNPGILTSLQDMLQHSTRDPGTARGFTDRYLPDKQQVRRIWRPVPRQETNNFP